MGERLLYGIALRLFLQVVVSDDGGAVDGLLQVSVFQGTEEGALVVAPHAGVEIGLELYAYAHAVGVGLGHPGHLAVGLVQGAQQVLDVVTHFMRDYVGVGEVPVGPQLLAHAGEEGEVYVQVFIGTAVKGAHGGLSLAAGSAGASRVEDQGRGLVVSQAVVGKIPGPDVFRGSQDLPGEFGQGLVLGGGLVTAHRLSQPAGLYYGLEYVSQVSSHQEGKDSHNGYAADSQAGGLATDASTVFYMGAFAPSVQFHNSMCFRLL